MVVTWIQAMIVCQLVGLSITSVQRDCNKTFIQVLNIISAEHQTFYQSHCFSLPELLWAADSICNDLCRGCVSIPVGLFVCFHIGANYISNIYAQLLIQ